MSITKMLAAQIKQEGANTKRMIEIIPADHFDWKPHEKSMSLKNLAVHIATLAAWPGLIAGTEELDFANNNLPKHEINNTEDIIKVLETGVEESLNGLSKIEDKDLEKNWRLRNGDLIILELPKSAFISGMALDHLIHHRGQLSVYLRMLDVPIPGMYGPSADDKQA